MQKTYFSIRLFKVTHFRAIRKPTKYFMSLYSKIKIGLSFEGSEHITTEITTKIVFWYTHYCLRPIATEAPRISAWTFYRMKVVFADICRQKIDSIRARFFLSPHTRNIHAHQIRSTTLRCRCNNTINVYRISSFWTVSSSSFSSSHRQSRHPGRVCKLRHWLQTDIQGNYLRGSGLCIGHCGSTRRGSLARRTCLKTSFCGDAWIEW